MNKRLWLGLPKGANYIAQDPNETWYWFTHEPVRGPEGWIAQQGEVGTIIPRTSLTWSKTLEKRPPDHDFMNDFTFTLED